MKTTLAVAALMCAVAASAETGSAKVAGTAAGSTIAGTVSFEDTKAGLKISAVVHGLTPGEHGFHIHEFGSCEDSAKAAGGHFNPEKHPHGQALKDGVAKTHAGDLGNITADANGDAKLEVTLHGVTLTRAHAVAGRAVVVHEKVDDFSQPVGNAGGRVACGLIGLVAPAAPATPAAPAAPAGK